MQMMERFGIESEIIAADDYHSVLDLVSHNQADAGVVNRFFGMKYGIKYQVEKSGVIFNPIKLHYAAPKGMNSAVIAELNRFIAKLKKMKTPSITSPWIDGLELFLQDGYFPYGANGPLPSYWAS